VMPPDVAFLVADILSDPAARAVTFGLDSPLATPFWSAVKTGTSKDMRDNWCVGFSDRYTVAVWVGNFEGDPMQDVSGISGAAPAWLDLMLALHADRPSVAPAPPAGLVARDVVFEPAIEPPRRSYFLRGTALTAVVAKTQARRTARIVNPPDGVIIAVDPDIPPQYQTLFVRSRGTDAAARLVLDGTALGNATGAKAWAPRPGTHRLELRAGDGQLLDAVTFTVRGLR
jgi:penicillin-binding protein 1C